MDIAIKVLVLCLAWIWPLYALRTGRALAAVRLGRFSFIERQADPHRFWFAFAIYLLMAVAATAILFGWRPA